MSLYSDPDSRYAIRGPEPGRPSVEFWSARRLPYDNKHDWERRLIAELAERLQRLVEDGSEDRVDRQWLRAVFASDDPIQCDAGNITYLNVGTRPYVTLGHRISLERWYEVPEEPCHVAWATRYRYYHRYSLGPSAEPDRWRQAGSLAIWDGVPCGTLTDEQSARHVWLAMRRHPDLISVERLTGAWSCAYGISVRVNASGGRLAMPAGILEAVIDGCLASFHRDGDREHAARVAATLSMQLHATNERELLSALTAPDPTLFAGPPFRRHRTFVQLSPCDERCLVGSLEVAHDAAARGRSLTGEIFAIERALH